MEGNRFDLWTRTLRSRRAAVAVLGGLALGVRPTPPAAAKRKKHKKWKAYGCTADAGFCANGLLLNCPDAPAGAVTYCALDAKGKPRCASNIYCYACASDADCVAGGICVPCSSCEQYGVSTNCVVPFQP